MSARLSRIGSGLEVYSLDEVAPAFVPIGGVLGIFILLQSQFSVLLAPDHSHYSGGEVGADVMSNNGVRGASVVVGQQESLCRKDQRRSGATDNSSQIL